MERIYSRRTILNNCFKGTAALFAISFMGPSLFSSCKKNALLNNKEKEANKTESVTLCPNQEKLSEQEKTARASLKYTDTSPIAHRRCDNCKLYTLPTNKDPCGGCKIISGPIHPKGYCTAWIQQM